jgi:hypothetical protein
MSNQKDKNNNNLVQDKIKEALKDKIKEMNNEVEFQRLQANLMFSKLFEDEPEGLFGGGLGQLIILVLQVIILLILIFKK